MHEFIQSAVPCDVEDNCSPNAKCDWVEELQRSICKCHPGFEGDGHKCTELEVSCVTVSKNDQSATTLQVTLF